MTTANEHSCDVGIVGAGPVGLAAAIAVRRAGLAGRVWDRGCLAASVAAYPTNMIFFTSNELLEIGDHPLVTGGPKASRREAMDYYRKVSEREGLHVETYTEVTGIARDGRGFAVTTAGAGGAATTRCGAVIVATGYYANPNVLGVPGEELPHVNHYFAEPHALWRRRVVIVGGGNSAVEAALELYRVASSVTMLVRGTSLRPTVKYWIRPDIENRIREGSVTAEYGAGVTAVTPEAVRYRRGDRELEVPADHVLLCTGYHADPALVRGTGAEVRPDGSVVLDPETFESTVPGLFVIGSAGFGPRTGEVFIENGRLHAAAAVEAIRHRLS